MACLHFIVVFLYFIAINILFSCFLCVSRVDFYLYSVATRSFDGNDADARVFFFSSSAPYKARLYDLFAFTYLRYPRFSSFSAFLLSIFCLELFFLFLFRLLSCPLSDLVHCQIIAVKLK